MIMTTKKNILLFVPNLIGYARLLFLVISMVCHSCGFSVAAASVWGLSCSLDFFDGILARKLDQCSKFGEVLDVVIDNLSRSAMWFWVAEEGGLVGFAAAALSSMEWMVFVATHAGSFIASGDNWKDLSQRQPNAFLSLMFSNGFKNPLGFTAVSGLFGLPVFLYVRSRAAWFLDPLGSGGVSALGAYLLLGRALAVAAELWLLVGHAQVLLEADQKPRTKAG